MMKQGRRSSPLLVGCGGCLLVVSCLFCVILALAAFVFVDSDLFASLYYFEWDDFLNWDPSALATPAPANPGDPPAQPNDSPSDPAGGPVLGTGDVQVTLRWDSLTDLDLFVVFSDEADVDGPFQRYSEGGVLDVDANSACADYMMRDRPVENIFWPEGGAPERAYRVFVLYYDDCANVGPTGFTVRVLVDGQVQEYAGTVSSVGETYEVVEFTHGPAGK